METIHKIDDIRKIISLQKREGKKVGLFATLGYLHDGHLKLIDIKDWMEEIGLWNVTLEQIKNTQSGFDIKGLNLTDKLEVLEQEITIKNNSNSTDLESFAITPRWNKSFKNFFKKNISWWPNILSYDNNKLTYKVNHTNVKIKHRIYCVIREIILQSFPFQPGH